MALIARDLMVGNEKIAELKHIPRSLAIEKSMGHNAIAAGFQGQRGWTDYQPNGDFLEAILCSSFDWNGRRYPYIVATENDALNGTAMLMSYLLTNTAQVFADVRTYWSPESIMKATGAKSLPKEAHGGLLHLINSGPAALDGTGRQEKHGRPAMKPYWEITEKEITKCLDATTWHPSDNTYFPGGGMSTRYTTRAGMPLTMARINIVKGLGPMMQIAEGYAVELPRRMHDVLDNRTNPTWPTTWFALKPSKAEYGTAFGTGHNTMSEWGANHGAFSYGHIGADLITLASMLRIPVAMHNVDEAKIFRPCAWSAFGTKDREGADFRACANFGPLYGKLKR
jgi:L-fucose isomerase